MKSIIIELLDSQLSDRINIFEKEQDFVILRSLEGKQMHLILSKTTNGKFYIEYLTSDKGIVYDGAITNIKYSYNELLEKLGDLLEPYGDEITLSVALVQYDYFVDKLQADNGMMFNNRPVFVKIIDGDGVSYPNVASKRYLIDQNGNEVVGIGIPTSVFDQVVEIAGTIKQ